MAQQNHHHSDLDSLQDNLLDCLPEDHEIPSNTAICQTLYSQDLLLNPYGSPQEDRQKHQTTTGLQGQRGHASQGGETDGHRTWLDEGYEENAGFWKIDQIKEVSEENTSLQETEYRPAVPSQPNINSIQFEVSEQPLGQFSQTLQQPQQIIIGEKKAQTGQREEQTMQEITQIAEERLNSPVEQAQIDCFVDTMPHVANQSHGNEPNLPQIAHEYHQTIEQVAANIPYQQLQPPIQPEEALQYFDLPIIDPMTEEPPVPKEDQIIQENKEEPMEIEFIGSQMVTYQSSVPTQDHNSPNKEQPMEIESQPMEIEGPKQPSICQQNTPQFLQQLPYYQTHHKVPAHTLIEPLLVPEVEPLMNESMIASNLFTFGKEHPAPEVKEGTNILQELQETESVYLPDEKVISQNQPLEYPQQQAEPVEVQNNLNCLQPQARPVEVQTNIQLSITQSVQLIFPQSNFIDPIPDSTLPQTSPLQTTPLQLQPVQNVTIKKQSSINDTEVYDRNESCDIVFCKFDQTDIVQDWQSDKPSTKQHQLHPNQLSQKQIVSKIQPPAEVQEQIIQHTQSAPSIPTQSEALLPTQPQEPIPSQHKAPLPAQIQAVLPAQPYLSLHIQHQPSLPSEPLVLLHIEPQVSLPVHPQESLHIQPQALFHAQPEASILPQNNEPQALIDYQYIQQERSNLQPETPLMQIQIANRQIISKVLDFLIPVSVQNPPHSPQSETLSSNINMMHLEPIPQPQNLKQSQFKVESAAHSYLMKGHLTEEGHKLFESVLTPYIQLKFLIEPHNAVGAHLCQNGLILIAITNLITRDSKSPWLPQYIYEYLQTTFRVSKYEQLFKKEMEKARLKFAQSLEKMLIRREESEQDIPQESKQWEEEQKPVRRRYQTTEFVSLQTDKVSHEQQTSHKRMVLNSNSISINQKLGPYKLPYTKVSQATQTSPQVQRKPLETHMLEEKPTQIQYKHSKESIDQRLESPLPKSKPFSAVSSNQKEGKAEDILVKLSQKLTKEDELKNQLNKKRQNTNPIYTTEQRKDSKQVPEGPTPEASKFNQLYEKYKKIRQSKSTEGNKIVSPQVYRVDQKQGDAMDHIAKKVQFAPDLRDEEGYRDEQESQRKKKKQRKSKGSKKDSSLEESDYEEHTQKEKLRKRGTTRK